MQCETYQSSGSGPFTATYPVTTNAYYFVYSSFSVFGASSNTYATFQVSINGNMTYTSTFYKPPTTYTSLGYLKVGTIITTKLQVFGSGYSVTLLIQLCYSTTSSSPPPPPTPLPSTKLPITSLSPVPPSSTTSSSPSSSSSILPLVIAILIVVAIVAALVIYMWKRKK